MMNDALKRGRTFGLTEAVTLENAGESVVLVEYQFEYHWMKGQAALEGLAEHFAPDDPQRWVSEQMLIALEADPELTPKWRPMGLPQSKAIGILPGDWSGRIRVVAVHEGGTVSIVGTMGMRIESRAQSFRTKGGKLQTSITVRAVALT